MISDSEIAWLLWRIEELEATQGLCPLCSAELEPIDDYKGAPR
jgi:hypothetical protein